MLEIEFNLGRISASQAHYRAQGTMRSARLARRIMGMRLVLERKASRFLDRQREAAVNGDAFLKDGRQSTVRDNVLDSFGRQQWPVVSAAILQGAQLPVEPLFPGVTCPTHDPGWVGCHEAYLAILYDGPADSREFKELAALAMYMAPLNKILIVWIGAEIDRSGEIRELTKETDEWTNLEPISTQYHELLSKKCRNYVK